MDIRLKEQSCETQTAAGCISYLLSRSLARKTLTICVKDDQRVYVAAPLFLSDQKIQSFVDKKASWIVKSLDKFRSRGLAHQSQGYHDGEEFLFLGQTYRLSHVPSALKRMTIDLTVHGFEASVPFDMPCEKINGEIRRVLFAWYRTQAARLIAERLPLWTEQLGVDVQKAAIRSQKRIWGSCYYRRKRININWKIAMLPEDIIDYILVHELCHFFVPDHSKRFWDKVGSVLPDFERSEQWLKEHEILTRLG